MDEGGYVKGGLVGGMGKGEGGLMVGEGKRGKRMLMKDMGKGMGGKEGEV